jgi:hypothetical protein
VYSSSTTEPSSDAATLGGIKLGAVDMFIFTLTAFSLIGLACTTAAVLSINRRINNIQSSMICYCTRPHHGPVGRCGWRVAS